jgi:predicted hydrocarbon binding protein
LEEAAKAFAPMIKQFFSTIGNMGKAFYEKYGDEALPVISEVMGKNGVAMGEMSKGMVQAEGMKAVGQLFGMFAMFDMGLDVVEVSDDTVHFKIAPCPLCIEGTSRELCEAMMTSDKKMVETLIGQEVEMEIPKAVAVGDEYCEVLFKK